MAKRGSRQALPFDFASCQAIAALKQNDDGDGVCCACGGAGHAKKPHWTIAPGHCWPLTHEPTALAGWLHAQRPEERVL